MDGSSVLICRKFRQVRDMKVKRPNSRICRSASNIMDLSQKNLIYRKDFTEPLDMTILFFEYFTFNNSRHGLDGRLVINIL